MTSRDSWRGGVQPADPARVPYPPGESGRVINRKDDRIRLATKLIAEVGDLLVVEVEAPDLLVVVGAEVYAVHPQHGYLDCRWSIPIIEHVTDVVVRRTLLRKVAKP